MGLQPLGLPLSLQEARRDEIAPLINNKREALERKEKAEKKMHKGKRAKKKGRSNFVYKDMGCRV